MPFRDAPNRPKEGAVLQLRPRGALIANPRNRDFP